MVLGDKRKLLLALVALLAAGGVLGRSVFTLQDDAEPEFSGQVSALGGPVQTGVSDADDFPPEQQPQDQPAAHRPLAVADRTRTISGGGKARSHADDGTPVAHARTAPVQDEPAGLLAGLAAAMAPARAALEQADGSLPPTLAANAAPGREGSMDWTALFQDLIQRERGLELALEGTLTGGSVAPTGDGQISTASEAQFAPPPPPVDPTLALTGVSLRGILSGPSGGMVLLDGHVLRRGDAIPGTRFVLSELGSDRVRLIHPDLDEPVQLMLAPMARSTASPSSVPASGSESPTDG